MVDFLRPGLPLAGWSPEVKAARWFIPQLFLFYNSNAAHSPAAIQQQVYGYRNRAGPGGMGGQAYPVTGALTFDSKHLRRRNG